MTVPTVGSHHLQADVFSESLINRALHAAISKRVDFAISCYSGRGMEELINGITTRLRNQFVPEVPPLIVRERQKILIQVQAWVTD